MRPFDKNMLRAFAFAALTVLSARSYASDLVAQQDTLRFSSPVGVSSNGGTYIMDADSTSGLQVTAEAWITGSGDFTISDTILSFQFQTFVNVTYTPSSLTGAVAVLHVQGNSNEVNIVLIGSPIDHQNLSFSGSQDLGTLYPGVQVCDSVTLHNPNTFGVTITSLSVDMTGCTGEITGEPSLPFTLGEESSVSFEACVTASGTGSDSTGAGGAIHAVYSFDTAGFSGVDSALYSIMGYSVPLDSSCITLSNNYFGSISDGDTGSAGVSVTNTTDSVAIIDSIVIEGGDVGQFQIASTQFPITLQPGASGTFRASFFVPSTAADGQSYSVSIMIFASGTSNAGIACSSMSGSLSGQATVPVQGTITLLAPPGGASTFSISTYQPLSRYKILIKNDTDVVIEPEVLQIQDTTGEAYFNVVGNESITLNDSIPAGDSDTWNNQYLTLDAPDTGTYDIALNLTYIVPSTSHKLQISSLESYSYHVVVHRVPPGTDAVGTSAMPTLDFSLMPNPARGNVTISVPTGISSTVQIYDVLGNLIMSRQASSTFVWNGETSAGAFVADGAYIVRVTEVGSGGLSATSSKQLMFLR